MLRRPRCSRRIRGVSVAWSSLEFDAGSELAAAGRSGAVDDAERGRTDAVARQVERGVVQKVEELAAQLRAPTLANRGGLDEGGVHIGQTRSRENRPAARAGSVRRGHAERVRVEAARDGPARAGPV